MVLKDKNEMTNHFSRSDFQNSLQQQSMNVSDATKEHLQTCERCAEFVEVLQAASSMSEHIVPNDTRFHFSRIRISEIVNRIYEQSIQPQVAADFLHHLKTCQPCFDHTKLIFKECFDPLPGYLETNLPDYSRLSIADHVLQAAPYQKKMRFDPGRVRDLLSNALPNLNLRRKPLLGLVVAVLVVFFLGQKLVSNWRAGVHTKAGMAELQQNWRVTDADLRPPGDFPLSIISITRGTRTQQDVSATTEFTEALSWKKNDTDALRGLALYYYFKAQLGAADSLVDELLTKNPEDFASWNLSGLIAAGRADTTAALDDFAGAIQIKPDYAEAIYNRATILELIRRPEEAKAAWQKYLQIDAHSGWAEVARTRLEFLN